MKNNLIANVFVYSIDNVTELKETKCVSISIGGAYLFIDEKPLEIKVGDNKIAVSTYEFMQAFKDMLDTGTFELDQIDSAVWSIESKLEETQEKLTGTMDFIQSKGWC